jgi:hypothetical protein
MGQRNTPPAGLINAAAELVVGCRCARLFRQPREPGRFDSNGVSHSRTSVPLVQAGEDKSKYGYFCEWMPYQVGQAAKAAVGPT